MTLHITSHIAFDLDQPTDVLLQFEAAHLPEQSVVNAHSEILGCNEFTRVPAQDGIGERIWLRGQGRIEVDYRAEVALQRIVADLPTLVALAPHDLPGETVQYLFDSRYCRGDEFQSLVETEFAGTEGGARVDAIRQWIAENFSYVPGSSDSSTDAAQSFIMRQGTCRDYAHVLVTMARASTIPARYVACYSPGVTPQDFHAVAEVFLSNPTDDRGGAWHLVDATGMATASDIAKIGIGRDAADVSFLTSFGPSNFDCAKVSVREG